MPRSVNSPVRQKSWRPTRHAGQSGRSQGRRTMVTTRSPSRKLETPLPVSTTWASDSWPMTRWSEPAGGVPYSNAAISRSVPHTPTSRMRTLTSWGPATRGDGWSMRRTCLCAGKAAMALTAAPPRGRARVTIGSAPVPVNLAIGSARPFRLMPPPRAPPFLGVLPRRAPRSPRRSDLAPNHEPLRPLASLAPWRSPAAPRRLPWTLRSCQPDGRLGPLAFPRRPSDPAQPDALEARH